MLQEHARKEFHGLYHEQQPAEQNDRKSRHMTYQASWHNLNFTTLASENRTSSSDRRQPIYEPSREEGFNKSWSKMKPKKAKGEVIDVHGGRIVRSAGRKDRHSKVCTARGPRDRRVRLSPNTAIQFYDVQDRLGYDRPSKAIDWLLKEAKAAIDALEDSTQATNMNDAFFMNSNDHHSPPGLQDHSHQVSDFSNSKYAFQNHEQMNDPTSHMSFFSMVNGATPSSSSEIQRLSGSFQAFQNGTVLFPGDSNGTFSTSTPSHSQINPGMATFRRFFSWDANEKRNDQELLINSLPLEFPVPALSQNHVFLQREPLQSTLCPIGASSTMQFSNVNVSYSSFGFANDGLISVLEEQNPVSGRPSSAPSLLQD